MRALAIVAFLALTLGAAALLLWLVRARPPEPLPKFVLASAGEDEWREIRCAVAAGDCDGDGVMDVASLESRSEPTRDELRVHSGATHVLLDAWPLESLGVDAALLAAGDLDGDSATEYLVGRPRSPHEHEPAGDVLVVSGRDGATLATLVGVAADEQFGSALCTLGDVDADGVPDFAIASQNHHPDAAGGDPQRVRGAVTLYSGRELRVLARVDGRHAGARLGRSLAKLGDLDGDGASEWLVGAFEEDGIGCVEVRSGRDGVLMRVVRGDLLGPAVAIEAALAFGASVAGLGDVDGDGMPDLAAGAVEHLVALVSGSDGTCLRVMTPPPPPARSLDFTSFGRVLAAGDDLDGDGARELIVGAPGWEYRLNRYSFTGGRVFVYSSRSGATLLDLQDVDGYASLGTSIAPLGDIDADGVPELLAATREELRVYSLRR